VRPAVHTVIFANPITISANPPKLLLNTEIRPALIDHCFARQNYCSAPGINLNY